MQSRQWLFQVRPPGRVLSPRKKTPDPFPLSIHSFALRERIVIL